MICTEYICTNKYKQNKGTLSLQSDLVELLRLYAGIISIVQCSACRVTLESENKQVMIDTYDV